MSVKIIGVVHSIKYPKVYHDGDWAVFYVRLIKVLEGEVDDANYGYLTFSGETPSLIVGAEYMLLGELTETKYGKQYNLLMMNENVDFDSPDGKRRFLEQIVPPKTLISMYSKYEDPIELLKNGDIKGLTQIKGIGVVTAQRLIKRYDQTADLYGLAFAELSKYGITMRMIKKMCQQYASQDVLIKKFHENPYCLIDDVDGIGWVKADDIAMSFGIAKDSDIRIDAAIKYCLSVFAENNGHTWVYDQDLIAALEKTLDITCTDKIINRVKQKIADGVLYYERDTRRIGLMSYRVLEQNISRELHRISESEPSKIFGIDETISECEREVGFTYTDEQKEIINNILTSQNVAVITGLAGSGKSSIMLPITRAFDKNCMSVLQVALSGKAALNLTEITGIQGMTIHRALKYDGVGFKYNKCEQMPYDVIIVDELSMVGGYIFYSLIQAVKYGAKLIMIGDPGQLESIGLCNCLYDIIGSNVIPHYHLSKIMRQAQDSAIITESFKIYNSEQIIPSGFNGEDIRGKNKDFKIISAIDSLEMSNLAVKQFKEFYDSGVAIDDICMITCKRSIGECSARAINERIHELVTNKEDPLFISRKYTDSVQYETKYRAGDRILITKNCYDTISEDGYPMPVFNGNVGTIKWVKPEDRVMCASFQQDNIILDEDTFGSMQLGYAMTCHKTQGSGFKYVIALLDPSAYTLNSKEMLYTQITRAKKKCVLIGPTVTIRGATQKTSIRKKQTWLKELLEEVFYVH